MSRKGLLWTIFGWCILMVIMYYFLPYFIVTLLWIGLSVALFIILIIQSVKLIKERKALTGLRISKIIAFGLLFYFSFNIWSVNNFIEKIDWRIFYNKRMGIVEQVKNKELTPNVSWNNWICELPFNFPVISHGGNDIGIFRNKGNDSITVIFYTYRNFFSAPSTYFIYTNDEERKEWLEALVKRAPDNNWKIEENWYRACYE